MIKSLIEESNVQELLFNFSDSLTSVYPVTYRELRGRRRPEFFGYALGDERHWAGMEALYESARTAGYAPEIRFNRNRTTRYTFVRIGRLIMTASRTRYPDERLRFAHFRNAYTGFGRFSLFSKAKQTDKPDLFGVLVHGCFDQDPAQLGFLRIVLPAKGSMKPLASLDVLRYLSETSLPSTIEEERIPRATTPRLRKHKKVQEE